MNKKFPYVIFASGIFISIVAEYFSILGINKLFSGSNGFIILLVIGLGISKLVAISALQQYWEYLGESKFGNAVRLYLSIAGIILILITSVGVYGYLAASYQSTADADRYVQTKIALLKTKRDRFNQQQIQLSQETVALSTSLEQLRKSLSTDNQYQYVDRKTGQVVTQIQSAKKTSVQRQIDIVSGRQDTIQLKIDKLNDSIAFYDLLIIETEANSETTSELGPLRYISTLTGISMDRIVNWLMMLLVIVVDPLAIILILTAQFAIKLNLVKPSTINDPIPPTPDVPDVEEDRSEGKSEASSVIPDVDVKPKKRGRPRGSKNKKVEEHFNIEIDPIADPDGEFSNRTIVNSGLTTDTHAHLAESLGQNKKLTDREIKMMSHEQLNQWEIEKK